MVGDSPQRSAPNADSVVKAGKVARSDKNEFFLGFRGGYIDFFATFASIGKIRT